MLFIRLLNSALRHALLVGVSLFILFSLCALASAQTVSDDETIKVTSDLVQLNVGVADPKGRPVIDLSRNDFVVYEDGVRQTIQQFEPTQSPFSLVLLLDMSGSTLNFRTTLKQAATRFIDALGPEDRVSVVTFHVAQKKGHREDKIEMLAPFTTDRRKIFQAISLAEGAGETNFYKALQYSLKELDKEGKRRKAIVVLTDGIDTELDRQDRILTANATTNEAAIAAVNPEASPALNSVLNAADRQGVTIFPMALPSGDPQIFEPLSPPQAAKYAAARARLEALANRTGGQL
ncbi:MAG TPA: VWA domain-containing protein, partial [Pyrinomonadaceae bacterium]|nr:VWA domain-containing protein [Pyrinomonadaceae bacterium]